MARPKVESPKTTRSLRLTPIQIEKGERLAKERGFSSISELMRYLLQKEIEENENKKTDGARTD